MSHDHFCFGMGIDSHDTQFTCMCAMFDRLISYKNHIYVNDAEELSFYLKKGLILKGLTNFYVNHTLMIFTKVM